MTTLFLWLKGLGRCKLRIWRREEYLEISSWTQCNRKGPYKKEAKGSESEKEIAGRGGMVKERIKERFEDATLLALKMEERVMSQGMQAA